MIEPFEEEDVYRELVARHAKAVDEVLSTENPDDARVARERAEAYEDALSLIEDDYNRELDSEISRNEFRQYKELSDTVRRFDDPQAPDGE